MPKRVKIVPKPLAELNSELKALDRPTVSDKAHAALPKMREVPLATAIEMQRTPGAYYHRPPEAVPTVHVDHKVNGLDLDAMSTAELIVLFANLGVKSRRKTMSRDARLAAIRAHLADQEDRDRRAGYKEAWQARQGDATITDDVIIDTMSEGIEVGKIRMLNSGKPDLDDLNAYLAESKVVVELDAEKRDRLWADAGLDRPVE